MALSLHAKISADGMTILDRRQKDPATLLPKADAIAKSKPYWLPIIERGPRPAYDPTTHYAPQPTEAIDADQVTQGWDDATAKTPSEIDAELDDIVNQIRDNRGIIKALGLTLFDVANQVRALNSQPDLTLAQFKAFVKSKL